MRFAATHKVVSYLMVLTAFAVLALSGELPRELTAVTTVGALLSFPFDPQRRPFMNSRLYKYGWNAILILLFALSINAWMQDEALLSVGTRLLCYLLLAKLWNRHGNRDYLHAYIISFFMLVSGSILNNNLVYGVCFVGYVVFSTWTLSLFHLRREMEENYLLKHLPGKDGKAAESERVEVDRILNSRRVVGREFLLGTSLISLGIFLVSAVVFFFTPRLSMGLDVGLQRHGLTTAGFAERIELGGYGRIRDNPQIAMRVEIPSGRPERPIYMRGVTFDRYERGRWIRTRRVPPHGISRYQNKHVLYAGSMPLTLTKLNRTLARSLRTEIYLEPMDTNVLFVPSRPVAVAPPDAVIGGLQVYSGPGGEFFAQDRKGGLRYSGYSDVEPPPVEALRSAADLPVEHDDALEAYLDVPESLPPRVRQLAQQLTQGVKGPHGKALAILGYLQKNYTYTTQLERDERFEPLEDFLFQQKQGHCEYFASAMAMLLRVAGVPSRSVNGYLGGEWNDYGRYLIIRQQNAHSWVEAYLDGVGWVTYDPTPPAGTQTVMQSGPWQRVRQLFDTVELSWFKYVIEYDLRTQLQMAEGAYRYVRRGKTERQGFGLRARLRALKDAALAHAKEAAVTVAASAGLLYALYRMRGRLPVPTLRRRPQGDAQVEQALRLLYRRGFTQGPSETLQQLAERVRAARDPAGPPFLALVLRYYASRFGHEPVPLQELKALTREVLRAPPPPKEAQGGPAAGGTVVPGASGSQG
jgi:transglutaminase-like putative cysteine protease